MFVIDGVMLMDAEVRMLFLFIVEVKDMGQCDHPRMNCLT